jgi:hypothetical protein
MAVAAAFLLMSCAAIAALFGLKHWEQKRGRTLLESKRERFDAHALRLKAKLETTSLDILRLLPHAVRIFRVLLHEAALGLAVIARYAERQAHKLADLVSYKHRFEKRETKSEFLRKMSEHRGDLGLDTTSINRQNE